VIKWNKTLINEIYNACKTVRFEVFYANMMEQSFSCLSETKTT